MKTQHKTRSYGEGSVYQRKDGRWVAKYKSEEMIKPHVLYGKSEAEVKRKLREFKKETARGLVVCRKMYFRDYAKRWLYSFKQPSVESTTFDRYESIYLNHLEPAFGSRQMSSIRGIEIQNFLVEKSAIYSFKYVKSMRILLSELFAYAHTEGDIVRNPMRNVKPPKKDSFKAERVVTTLEDSDVVALEQTLWQKKKNGKIRIPYAGLIVFLLHTGLRCGELLALKWSDIDLDEKTVTINKNLATIIDRDRKDDMPKRKKLIKSPKTASGYRVVPLNKKAITALELLQKNQRELGVQSEFVAISRNGNPLCNKELRRVLERMIKSAGIDCPCAIHPLRHTFATRSLRAGVPISVVSKWLGHANISVTLDTYIHASKLDERSAAQILEAM